MPVTDEHVASVRDYLTATGEDHQQLDLFGRPDVWPVYTLVSATFTKAMKATFATARDDPRATTIRFVGAMRAKSTRAVRIDPRVAEWLIDLALGRTPERQAGPVTAHATRLRMLRAMVVDGHLETAGLDDLLQRARHLADLRLSFRYGIQARSWTERAFLADLTHDEPTFQQREGRFGPLDIAEHARLVTATLRVLLGGRRVEVVELVGEVRARSRWWADHVNPLAAERAIRDVRKGITDISRWRTARLLLRALVDEAWLEAAERYELLIQAREAGR
jgi:hypothetical protein